MIITITLNPALSITYEARQVRRGEVNQVPGVRHLAAGHDVTAAGLAGGATGEMIRLTWPGRAYPSSSPPLPGSRAACSTSGTSPGGSV